MSAQLLPYLSALQSTANSAAAPSLKNENYYFRSSEGYVERLTTVNYKRWHNDVTYIPGCCNPTEIGRNVKHRGIGSVEFTRLLLL